LFIFGQLFLSEHFALLCLSLNFQRNGRSRSTTNAATSSTSKPATAATAATAGTAATAATVNPVNQPAGQVPIVQAQVVRGANGNMDIKIQQTKLPEFLGQKDKDSISANEFVKRVDKMKSANTGRKKSPLTTSVWLSKESQMYGWIRKSSLPKLRVTENNGPSFVLISRKSLQLNQMTNSSWTVSLTWL
jgi:hypothetical protein